MSARASIRHNIEPQFIYLPSRYELPRSTRNRLFPRVSSITMIRDPTRNASVDVMSNGGLYDKKEKKRHGKTWAFQNDRYSLCRRKPISFDACSSLERIPAPPLQAPYPADLMFPTILMQMYIVAAITISVISRWVGRRTAAAANKSPVRRSCSTHMSLFSEASALQAALMSLLSVSG